MSPEGSVRGRVRGRRRQDTQAAGLTAHHLPPEGGTGGAAEDVVGAARNACPGTLGDLARQLPGGPPGVPGEDREALDLPGKSRRVTVEIDKVDVVGHQAQPAPP